jgi:hypothetical protein
VILLARKCGILDVSELYRSPRPATEILYFLLEEAKQEIGRSGLEALLKRQDFSELHDVATQNTLYSTVKALKK